jgi:hypothetical protein
VQLRLSPGLPGSTAHDANGRQVLWLQVVGFLLHLLRLRLRLLRLLIRLLHWGAWSPPSVLPAQRRAREIQQERQRPRYWRALRVKQCRLHGHDGLFQVRALLQAHEPQLLSPVVEDIVHPGHGASVAQPHGEPLFIVVGTAERAWT